MTGNRTASFKFEIFWSHCIFSLVCCLFQMIDHWHQGDKTGWTTCIGYWYCTLGTTTFQKLFSHYRYFIETLEKQLNLTIKTFSAHRRAFYAHNTKLAHLSKADATIASGCTFYSGVYVTSFLVFHTKVTVNIGLKKVFRMVTSIPWIRCLCYKPERIEDIPSLPPTQAKNVCTHSF